MTNKQPLPVIVIGGVYDIIWPDDEPDRVTVKWCIDSGWTRVVNDRKESFSVHSSVLHGPVAMPCPLCGKVVQTDILPWHMNSECSQ